MNEGQNGGFNGSAVNFGAQNNAGAQPAGAQPAAGQAARPLIPGGRRPVQTVPVRTMPPQSAPAMTNMTPSPSQPAASPFGQQLIMSSGEGDVILGGGAPEKKSRGGVIALVVLVILVALAGGGYALWQSGVLGGGGSAAPAQQSEPFQPSANLAVELRKSINYMYSGVQSDAVLTEIPDDAKFRFETEFSSDNLASRTEYFETAMTLHNNVMETLLGNEDDAESAINTTLTNIGASLGRVSVVAMIDKVSMGSLTEDYAQYNSVPRLKEIVEERYKGLLDSGSDGLEFYGQAYIDFFDMRAEELALIVQNGCLEYVYDWEDLTSLSTCPNIEQFIGKIKDLEAAKGKLGFTPGNEKNMADDLIEGDIKSLAESYRWINTELNR